MCHENPYSTSAVSCRITQYTPVCSFKRTKCTSMWFIMIIWDILNTTQCIPGSFSAYLGNVLNTPCPRCWSQYTSMWPFYVITSTSGQVLWSFLAYWSNIMCTTRTCLQLLLQWVLAIQCISHHFFSQPPMNPQPRAPLNSLPGACDCDGRGGTLRPTHKDWGALRKVRETFSSPLCCEKHR